MLLNMSWTEFTLFICSIVIGNSIGYIIAYHIMNYYGFASWTGICAMAVIILLAVGIVNLIHLSVKNGYEA